MVVDVDILGFARIYCPMDSYKEILPASISQYGLQLSGKPDFYLFVIILTV